MDITSALRQSKACNLAMACTFAVLVAACGSADTPVATGEPGTDPTSTSPPSVVPTTEPGPSGAGENGVGDLAFGLRQCRRDDPELVADPAFYRDQPIYVGNEQPTEAVREWAQTQPGFEDIWLDRDHNGWISVGFSEGVAERQSELEAEFPGVGVVAVEVTATEAELLELRGQVHEVLAGMDNWGLSHGVPRGQVEANVAVLDEETLSLLAPLAGPLLCVTGTDPADAIQDGPQPTSGDGWRLLGTDRTGQSYRTGIATTPEQYEALWGEAGLTDELPIVDFDDEVVIWFGAVYGSSCEIRMDDVVIDLDRQLVHGEFVLPGNPTACTSDANSEAYVVAVRRDRLPAAPFDVQLSSEDPPRGVPEERTTVSVDLRPSGATIGDGDMAIGSHDDTDLGAPEVFVPGMVIETGYPWMVRLDPACSLDVLGPLNGVMFRTDDAAVANGLAAAWEPAIDADGLIVADLLLENDPARLTVTAADTPVTYEAVPASVDADMSCA